MNKKDKNYCVIYIVRHGQTDANVQDIVAGHFDSFLTEEGRKQAEEAADLFKDINFDAVFSSDLVRAKNTAEIIKLNRNLAVNTTKLLRERFFGKYEGLPGEKMMRENKQTFEKLATLSEKEKLNFRLYDSYETEAEIAGRMFRFLREIGATFLGKTVLVVSHGAIMRSLLMHLGFARFDEIPPGSLKNTGYIKLETDGVDFFIQEVVGVEKASE